MNWSDYETVQGMHEPNDFKWDIQNGINPIDDELWLTVSLENQGHSREIVRTPVEEAASAISKFKDANELRECFYVAGIHNLIIKANFLQHNLRLAEGMIDQDEFAREIDENPDEYIINIRETSSLEELLALKDVVKRLGKDFTIDEVSEIFAVSFDNVEKLLNQ